MLTICWAAKGGSGTTVFTASRAVCATTPTLLVDLAGDVPLALGLDGPDAPGVCDWLRSDAPVDRLTRLEQRATDHLAVLPAGSASRPDDGRWFELCARLRADERDVIVDAGTGPPPEPLAAAADHRLLVTRACYLALRRPTGAAPTGIVLIEEPGRSFRSADVAAALGAPVVCTALLDPVIARAVDAGLLMSRLPGGWQRRLRAVA